MKKIYREKKDDKVWWLDNSKAVGELVFTLDKKTFYNLFRDYPDKLTVQEWVDFNKENPYWEEFFKDRNIKYKLDHFEEVADLIEKGIIQEKDNS